MRILLGLLWCLALWSGCHGYYQYQTAIPNGQQVPHPCKPNFIWHGVGHQNPGGGGERNPFGQDFARLGHKWSAELCQLDSDGDGLTNGQELGDPQCVWTTGALPQRTDNITHPGVCDPWGSPQCGVRNTWVTCDTGEFACDAINATDVRNVTIRFPRTKVPPAETSYVCFVFDLPHDQPYHLIANKAVIDNPNVMHHMAILACEDDVELLNEPVLCDNMGNLKCGNIIGIWTLGMAGECLNPLAGFRIGQGGYKRVALQFHWTNKHHVDSWYDSSGLTLYYTPKLRPNDAGTFLIGQNSLHIPPAVKSMTINGSCSSSCTQKYMHGDAHIMAILNHMHYLGISGNVEHIRGGHVIADLSPDHPYSYDSPHVHYFDNPVLVKPGDELKMVCEFSSLSKDTTTVDGDGSYNEMCYGLITFYPATSMQKIRSCIQYQDQDLCELRDPAPNFCDYFKLWNATYPATAAMFEDVMAHCLPYGPCHSECPAVIAKYREINPCLNGTSWDMLKRDVMRNSREDLMKFIVAIETCDNAAVIDQLKQATSALATPTQNCTQPAAVHGQHLAPAQQQPAVQESLSSLGAFMQLAQQLGSRPLLQNIIFNNNHGN